MPYYPMYNVDIADEWELSTQQEDPLIQGEEYTFLATCRNGGQNYAWDPKHISLAIDKGWNAKNILAVAWESPSINDCDVIMLRTFVGSSRKITHMFSVIAPSPDENDKAVITMRMVRGVNKFKGNKDFSIELDVLKRDDLHTSGKLFKRIADNAEFILIDVGRLVNLATGESIPLPGDSHRGWIVASDEFKAV